LNKKTSDYNIESIKRAVQILNSFSVNEYELGVTELSKRLNLYKSTVYRTLLALMKEGLVVKNQVNQKYSLGLQLFRWGSIVQNKMEIRNSALPIMQNLVQNTGETVDLSIISNRKRIIIEKINSPNDIRRVIKLGEIIPLYIGAGKVLLASLPDEEIKQYLKEEKLVSLTPNTITDSSKLIEELHKIRERSYGIAMEEGIPGIASIGAPILNYTGKVVGAISISGPTLRFTKRNNPRFISLVREAAMKISVLLGYNNR
jgi:DNA-binding IclR family transcriptional regulator